MIKAAVYLNQSKQSKVEKGHPWIFPKAIERTEGSLVTGELVTVLNTMNEIIGVGVYNEHSLYRVRVLAYHWEPINIQSLDEILNYRIEKALLIRQNLGLPNALTNAFRLFNSEADGLSGLIIDHFNNILVISSSAYWVESNQSAIKYILQKRFPTHQLMWLSQEKMLTQEGWKGSLSKSSALETTISEEGILYEINFSSIQKTGLFLDQRENHQRIGNLAKDKRVLDLYSYTGGFALHAAKGGAAKITAVDSSSQAIKQAKHNAILNQVQHIEFIEADARDYLASAGNYDLVILDPPKLVPSQKHIQRAKNYYRFLHRELFKVMQSGSLLMTCNCSSALSATDFTLLVCTQAKAVGKHAKVLGVFGPASCHPTDPLFPEGAYLTAVLIAVV